jgi:glucokinase
MLSGGVDGKDVFEKFHAGDADATAVVHTFVSWIAEGLASLTNICDPEVIVIGGGVIESFADGFDLLEEKFSQSLYSSQMRPHPRLVPAALGEKAGAVGAALLVAEVVI